MNTTLPPRPDDQEPGSTPWPVAPGWPAPRPKPKTNWWKVAGATVIVLLILGVAQEMATNSDQPAKATGPAITPPAETSETPRSVSEVAGEAGALMLRVGAELDEITDTSSISSDVRHLNNAADLTDRVADLFAGVDAQQQFLLTSAADHLRAAAVAEAAGDWGTAADEMSAFADDMDTARKALP